MEISQVKRVVSLHKLKPWAQSKQMAHDTGVGKEDVRLVREFVRQVQRIDFLSENEKQRLEDLFCGFIARRRSGDDRAPLLDRSRHHDLAQQLFAGLGRKDEDCQYVKRFAIFLVLNCSYQSKLFYIYWIFSMMPSVVKKGSGLRATLEELAKDPFGGNEECVQKIFEEAFCGASYGDYGIFVRMMNQSLDFGDRKAGIVLPMVVGLCIFGMLFRKMKNLLFMVLFPESMVLFKSLKNLLVGHFGSCNDRSEVLFPKIIARSRSFRNLLLLVLSVLPFFVLLLVLRCLIKPWKFLSSTPGDSNGTATALASSPRGRAAPEGGSRPGALNSPWWVCFAVISSLVGMWAFLEYSEAAVAVPQTRSKQIFEPCCFFESGLCCATNEYGEETRHNLSRPYDGIEHVLPCPSDGVCGFQVDSWGGGCEMTPAVSAWLARWIALLEKLSIAELATQCAAPAALPVFDYMEIQLLNSDTLACPRLLFNCNTLARPPLDIQVLQTKLNVQEINSRYFVGLHKDYLLELPFRCRVSAYVSSTMKASLQTLLIFCWTTVSYAGHILWVVNSAYPTMSLILLVVFSAVYCFCDYMTRRALLKRNITTLRDQAFYYLMETAPQAHADLHLRDALVAELVKDIDVLSGARRQRQYWNMKVWPYVVSRLQEDHRVKKTQRLEVSSGRLRKHWQWAASTMQPSASKNRGLAIDLPNNNLRAGAASS